MSNDIPINPFFFLERTPQRSFGPTPNPKDTQISTRINRKNTKNIKTNTRIYTPVDSKKKKAKCLNQW